MPYPLPKLDMVAIPDFVAGAMENYGLVTYQESALLYDEKISSASNKQNVHNSFSFSKFVHVIFYFLEESNATRLKIFVSGGNNSST